MSGSPGGSMKGVPIQGLAAIRDDVVVKLMLRLEDSSDWLKMLIDTGCERDPLDVIKDLEKGLIVFRSVFDRLISEHLPRHDPVPDA
jgi:hypothetical protein